MDEHGWVPDIGDVVRVKPNNGWNAEWSECVGTVYELGAIEIKGHGAHPYVEVYFEGRGRAMFQPKDLEASGAIDG